MNAFSKRARILSRIPQVWKRQIQLMLGIMVLGSLAIAVPAIAQAVYGSIFGTVTDTAGAVVPNATITVVDVSKNTSVSVTANGSGEYRVQHLIPDTYRIDVSAAGFSKSSTDNVIVFADTSPKVDIQLTVGAVTNTVTVTTAAPLLEADRADVSTILNARAVENLPNLNRNFTAFELLTPGTSYIGWNVGESENPQRSQQIEVNGQLPFATGYELDGTDNQEPIIGVEVINPDLDAVSEMKVTSQNYDAEFGKAVAGLVTAQTKSGSDALHGSAFEFRRSDAQQARDPFSEYAPDPLTGKFIPSNLHNQFGGSVGGPIKKDKLFFFGDYQGLREKTGSATTTTVPTALAHTSCTSGGDCNLSDYLNPSLGGGSIYQAYDPTSNPNQNTNTNRTPYPNNVIPAGQLSAPAVNLLKLMPLPTNPNSIVNNFVAFGSGAFSNDQFDVRIDDQLSQKLHIFGRYTRFTSSLSGAPFFGGAGGAGFGSGNFAGTDSVLDQSVAGGGDYALSPKWITDFRFGWFRVHINEEGPNYDQPEGTNLGIPGVNQGDLSLNGGLPQFGIDVPNTGANGSSVVTYGTTTNQFLQTTSQFQGVNNWTHTLGNHNIKFGGDIRWAFNHLVGVNNNQLRSGQFSFPASVTSGYISPTDNSSGLGYATFLLGDVNGFNRTQTANTDAEEHQHRMFYYAQDQWRVTNTLTLNYGLRYELYLPEAVNGKGDGGLLDLDTGDIRIAGYGSYNDSLNVNANKKLFAPRVGLAWQARKDTVIRTGYGRVYGVGWSGNTFGEVLTFSYPTQVNQQANASSAYTPSFLLQNGPPSFTFAPIPSDGNYPLPDGVSVPTRPINQRLPTLDAYNLTIQQQVGKDASLQIGYVGSHAIHNMFDSSNQASPNQQTLAGFNKCAADLSNVGQPGCSVADLNPASATPYSLNDRRPYYNGIAQTLGVPYGHPFGWTQDLRYNANSATSRYNALQVIFNKRYSQSFQLLTHYTWSRAQAHESDYYFIDHNADYGNSYYNRPNVFVATGNWDLPIGRGHSVAGNVPGWLNQVVGGFAINGTVTAEAGLPFTPNYAECSQDEDVDTGGSLCRPSKSSPGVGFGLGAGGFDPVNHRVKYFNSVPALTANGQVEGPYMRPAFGTFGNIERDELFGPGLVNTDASIAKKFNLTERINMQFRAEAFNLLNHPNLGQPGTQVDSPSGGYITGIVASQDGTSMRRLQFAARIEF